MAPPEGFGKYTYARVGGFSKQLQGFVEKYKNDFPLVMIGAAFLLGNAIKQATPYYRGRARAHWLMALNGRPGGYDPTLREEKGVSIDDEPILDFKLGDRIHIYNKAPYVYLLEAGWSPQSGPGMMVRSNVQRWAEFVKEAAEPFS